MFSHPQCSNPRGEEPQRWLGGWVLLLLALQSACVTGGPRARDFSSHSGLASATVYTVDFLETGTVNTRAVPVGTADFKQAWVRLARDVRLEGRSPRAAALALLRLTEPTSADVEQVEMAGQWVLEHYGDRNYSFVPLNETGPLRLTPEADEALRVKYLTWCGSRGGGDCLGVLDDGPYLRTDDRRALALALAFGTVLDETRAALAHELLDARALVAMVVWTVALYCMLWVVPEPTTKAVAASLTLLLVGWLGLDTVWGLMDGWSRMAERAHVATTFEELREAGEDFGEVLGQDAARTMILAVAALSGRTLGEVAARVKSLPGRPGAGQVELPNGQRWHLPRGKSVADLPTQDKVGDQLQEAVTRAASEWGPEQFSASERRAINAALEKGKYWLARLLEREARGRFVEGRVSRQFKNLYDFNNKGVDVIDARTGLRYEILSGSESNLALHGRRMASEFFRMLTF